MNRQIGVIEFLINHKGNGDIFRELYTKMAGPDEERVACINQFAECISSVK